MAHGDRGGVTKKRPKKPPTTRADKQAVVWAAEQNLAPWEVRAAPKPRGKRVEPSGPELLDHRYRVALAAPVSASARQRLAETMTPERRREHAASYRPTPPSRDRGLLGAITSTPKSVAHTLGEVGGAVERAAKYRVAHEPSPGEVLHGLRVAGQQGLGIDIRRFAHPVEGLKADAEARAANEREFARWHAQHPGASDEDYLRAHPPSEGIVPWSGPVKAGKLVGEAVSAGEKLAGKLGGAEKAAVEQEALRSPERGARIARGGEEFKAAGGGRAGLEAKSRALAGAYPRLRYRDFHEFDPEAVDSLLNEIEDHAKLTGWQKKRAQDAIRDALEKDHVPQPNQIALLRKVFGQQVTEDVVAAAEKDTSVWKKRALDIAGIPRAWQTTLDLSYLFRQGLVAGARHPVLFSRNVRPALRMLRSEKEFRAAMNAIRERPTFDLMDEAGIAFSDIDKDLSAREEAYVSTLAEKLTGGKKYSPVRASNRSYSGFLNALRADMFDHLLAQAQAAGVDLSNAAEREKFLSSLGRYINSATGRGDFGKALQGHALTMNTFLFSPRLLKSRFDFLMNPMFYANAHPFVRRQQIRAALQTLGAGMTVLGAAKMAGAKVSGNPTSADFGKIKLGNTRIDIFGGFQPWVRYFASLVLNQTTSTSTGETKGLGLPVPWGPPGKLGFGQRSGLGLLAGGFARSKLAPIPNFIVDFLAGQDMTGEEFQWKLQAYERLTPLLLHDLAEVYNQSGGELGVFPPKASWDPQAAAAGAGALALSGLGFGVTSYPPKKKKGRGSKLQSPYSGGVGGLQSPYSGSGGLPSPYGP